MLKAGLLSSDLQHGEVARTLATTVVGEAADEVPVELLPMPVPATCGEETRILTALRAGAAPRNVSKDFSRSARRAGHNAMPTVEVAH